MASLYAINAIRDVLDAVMDASPEDDYEIALINNLEAPKGKSTRDLRKVRLWIENLPAERSAMTLGPAPDIYEISSIDLHLLVDGSDGMAEGSAPARTEAIMLAAEKALQEGPVGADESIQIIGITEHPGPDEIGAYYKHTITISFQRAPS